MCAILCSDGLDVMVEMDSVAWTVVGRSNSVFLWSSLVVVLVKEVTSSVILVVVLLKVACLFSVRLVWLHLVVVAFF